MPDEHRFFDISNNVISNIRLKLGKNQANAKLILRLNFCYVKIIHILHPSYHTKTKINILKNKQKNKCVCIHTNNHNENKNEHEK